MRVIVCGVLVPDLLQLLVAVELFLHGIGGWLKECLVWRVEPDRTKPHELLGEADAPTPEWLDEVLP